MTQEEIIAGNKLIATFMGAKWSLNKEYFIFPKDMHIYGACKIDFNELEYHSSWKWLMSVVDKIDGLGFEVHVCSYMTHIFSKTTPEHVVEFVNKSQSGEIKRLELCYKTVVDFTKWYNENKKEHNDLAPKP